MNMTVFRPPERLTRFVARRGIAPDDKLQRRRCEIRTESHQTAAWVERDRDEVYSSLCQRIFTLRGTRYVTASCADTEPEGAAPALNWASRPGDGVNECQGIRGGMTCPRCRRDGVGARSPELVPHHYVPEIHRERRREPARDNWRVRLPQCHQIR
jgi:hypothetical protein